MTTAFVLSGGANLGAVQVGMLRALHEADVRPDVLAIETTGIPALADRHRRRVP